MSVAMSGSMTVAIDTRGVQRKSSLLVASLWLLPVLTAARGFAFARELGDDASLRAEVAFTPEAFLWPTPAPGEQVCGGTFGAAGRVEEYCLPGAPPAPFWYVPLLQPARPEQGRRASSAQHQWKGAPASTGLSTIALPP
jgi:hypothetical protein